MPDTYLSIMPRLYPLHLKFPYSISPMLQNLLVTETYKIHHRHVKTLMKPIEIETLYHHPLTTKPKPYHKIYPYLLR